MTVGDHNLRNGLLARFHDKRTAGWTARLYRTEPFATGDAASDIVQDFAQGDAHGDLDQSRVVDLAGEGKHLCPFRSGSTDPGKPFPAVVDDDGDVRPGFHIV